MDSTNYSRGWLVAYNVQTLTKFTYYYMCWSRPGSRFILNITLLNVIMWNAVRCMWIINRVIMGTNYCDLMFIITYLILCHQYTVNSSWLMDNMYNRYLEAVIPWLDISEYCGIEIAIHSYLIFLTLFRGKWLTTLMYILNVSLIMFSNLCTPVRESHGKGIATKVGIITLLFTGHGYYNV